MNIGWFCGLQVVRAIKDAATRGELEARKQALVAAQMFAAKASQVLAPHFADLAPVLLDCASDPSREVTPPACHRKGKLHATAAHLQFLLQVQGLAGRVR